MGTDPRLPRRPRRRVAGDDVVVGGLFFTLGGQTRYALGKVSLATAAADTTWNPNPGATVNALAFSGSSLLAGGSFASAGPQNIVRNGLARLNADGTLDLTWNPSITNSGIYPGSVRAMLLSGANLYIGGAFQRVGGAQQSLLAKVSTDTGALVAAWNPLVDGDEVDSLALSGDDLFVGGHFVGVDEIGNTPNRTSLAKLSASGSADLDPNWAPNALFGNVAALVVSGGSLYAGGSFADFNPAVGSPPPGGRSKIAKLSTTGNGDVDPTWDPHATGSGEGVTSLAVSGSDLFVGGSFTNIGGQPRNRLAKLSTTGTGAADATWAPSANSTVYGLALDGGNLYAAGQFTKIGALDRFGLARMPTTGAGAPDSVIAPAAPNGGTLGAVAVASAGRLFVGGSFTALGGSSLAGVGLYDLTAPTASVTVPAEGGRYAQGASVASAFSCGDPDGAANVASCAGTVANGAAFDTSTAGAHTFTVTATDAGGDTGSSTVNYVVDASAPTISVTTPAEGATYSKGQVVNAAYSCSDSDGAGDLASCGGPVASGAAIDTSTGGTHTFTVTATDVAGNATTNAVTYTVSVPAVPDTTAPAITGWRIRPTSFRAAASGASVGKGRAVAAKKKAPIGAHVSYALSEAAPKVVVTVLQVRKHKKPLSLGRFTVKGKAGANRFKFTGRINGGKLAPGNYKLSARATDAAKNTSRAAVATFKIVKR